MSNSQNNGQAQSHQKGLRERGAEVLKQVMSRVAKPVGPKKAKITREMLSPRGAVSHPSDTPIPAVGGESALQSAARIAFGTPPWDLAHSSESVLTQAMRGEFVYGSLGLVLGFAAIVVGIALAIHGIVGGSSWAARVIALRSEINDVTPGAVLFLVGLFVMWTTRPVVRLRDLER